MRALILARHWGLLILIRCCVDQRVSQIFCTTNSSKIKVLYDSLSWSNHWKFSLVSKFSLLKNELYSDKSFLKYVIFVKNCMGQVISQGFNVITYFFNSYQLKTVLMFFKLMSIQLRSLVQQVQQEHVNTVNLFPELPVESYYLCQ